MKNSPIKGALRIIATFFVLPCLAATLSLFVVTHFLLRIDRVDTANEQNWVDDVFRIISDRHVDAPRRDELAFSAIRGMVSSLDDYSDFVDPEEYSRFREQNEGQYVGIGFKILTGGEPVTVLYPFPGSPAEQAGLTPGDRIIAVDGEDCTQLSHDDVIGRIKKENGEGIAVRLRVQPFSAPGAPPLPSYEVNVPRANIELPSVYDAHLLAADPRIGYVRVAAFQEQTAKELYAALLRLDAQGITSLVLDLRQNRGGLLDQAIDVASFFLEPGDTVVTTEGRTRNSNQRYAAHKGAGAFKHLKLAMLIDSSTASASEVLAGALKDHMRAVLVGERTYGKGVVQSVIPRTYEVAGETRTGLLKITTSRYLTPSGRAIDKNSGLVPDAWVSLDEASAALLEDYFLDHEISVEMRKLIRERTNYRARSEGKFHDQQLDRAVEVLVGDAVFNTVY